EEIAQREEGHAGHQHAHENQHQDGAMGNSLHASSPPSSTSRFEGSLTATEAFCRVSAALMKASSPQQAIILEPPLDTKGKVTPVSGSRSTVPKTLSMV